MENNGTTQTLNDSKITTNATDTATFISSIVMDTSTVRISSVHQYLSSTILPTTVKAQSIEDFLEYQIGVALWKYMALVIIVFGLTGNVLSFLVMQFTSMNKTSSSIYLAALAIFDTGVLIVGLGRHWARVMFAYRIRQTHEWACKVHVFFTYLFIDLSAWMLICVTIERVILVYLPLRAKSICTKTKTKIVICLVTLFLVGLNCHLMFTLGQRDFIWNGKEVSNNCVYLEGFDELHLKYWPWIHASVASFVPFTVLLVSNTLIVLHLVKAATRRKNQMNVTGSKQDDATRSMTIMLVMISLLFLCFTSPIVILDVVIPPEFKQFPMLADKARQKLIEPIVHLCMYSNSAFNFVMYCLSGKKFRDSLRELFCGKKTTYKVPPNSGQTNQTNVSRTQSSTQAESEIEQNELHTISGSLCESTMNIS
ncbi:unnamed protein product [Owenia fusiformis]|uniref:Uncharacterized protein n=1 Tax=Owenia fusiformis TaxID=6347 RepID=A0A8J1TAX7_OWEFU|nr:unnamed protein product [Owenia fusiformis]